MSAEGIARDVAAVKTDVIAIKTLIDSPLLPHILAYVLNNRYRLTICA